MRKWQLIDGSLSVGDELSIAVSGSQLQYLLNRNGLYTRPLTGIQDFHIDSNFIECGDYARRVRHCYESTTDLAQEATGAAVGIESLVYMQ